VNSISEGESLVKLARETVNSFFENNFSIQKTGHKQKKGIFVSIHTYPDYELRGCIGYPYPELEFGESLQKAAISAAFYDNRFEPLKKQEMEKIIFEISIMTEPKLIVVEKPMDYLKKIKIGKDGLIVEYSDYKGLLLPQVPLESKPNWDAETFISHVCMKAGLSSNMWLNSDIKIFKFQAQIFKEKTPGGKIIQT